MTNLKPRVKKNISQGKTLIERQLIDLAAAFAATNQCGADRFVQAMQLANTEDGKREVVALWHETLCGKGN